MIKMAMMAIMMAVAVFGSGCSAADKKVEQQGVGVADQACLDLVPPPYSFVCTLTEAALDGLIQALATAPAGSDAGVTAAEIVPGDLKSKRLLAVKLLVSHKAMAAAAAKH